MPLVPHRLRLPLILIAAAVVFYVVARSRHDVVDFNVYRTAGLRAAAGEPLYQPADGHYQFKYLPAFALAAIPLGLIPEEAAKAAWFAISVWCLVVVVRRAVQTLPDRRLSRRALYWLTGLFLGRFYVQELVLGQTNLLLAVILLAAVFAARDRRWAPGVLVGLAIFVKPYAAIVVPWLAVARGWPALAACLATVAAGLIAPAAWYGWPGNLDLLAAWFATVTETTAPNLLHPENISLASLWAKWLGPGTTASSLALASSAVLLLAAGTLVALRRRVPSPAYLDFGVLMLLVPLVSPQGWDYVLVIATPAMVCLIDRWRDLPLGSRAVSATAIAVLSFTIFDLLGRALYSSLLQAGVLTLAALVVAATLLRMRQQALA